VNSVVISVEETTLAFFVLSEQVRGLCTGNVFLCAHVCTQHPLSSGPGVILFITPT